MNVPAAIRDRRSIRHFDPAHKITQEEIDQLLSLALHSPTAFNIQNWRFVLMQDPHLREKIKAASWGQPQVTDASLLVILCADLKAWEKEPVRYWRSAPESVREFIMPVIEEQYRGLDQAQRDEAMRSCGIAAQTLMLAATSMGLDSCPMNGFDADEVGHLINIPENHAICMFVAIGKSIGDASPPSDKLPMDEVVVRDTF